jgi:hypothetical protein
MPNFLWPGRQDASAIEDASLSALLSGGAVPEDLAAGLQPAADVLAALRARPASDELAGEALAMAEFRNRIGVPDPVRRSRPRRRPALLTSFLSAKVAVAAAAVAITIGGVATAAYAGALPGPAQRIAHDVIGAPAAHKDTHASNLTAFAGRPPVHVLCLAYARAKAHGTAAQQAAIYSKLVKAAGGAGKIAAYCRPVKRRPFHPQRPGCWMPGPHPSWMPSGTPAPQPSWTPSAKPSPRPSCTPARHPVFKPRRHHHHRVGTPGPGKPGPHPTDGPGPQPKVSLPPQQ